MRVRLSVVARKDLEEIADFIARDNPTRAEGFVVELLERCGALADHPARYAVFASRRGRELRRRPHGRYLIFYAADPAEIEIMRILHSARDYTRLLFPED